MYTGACVPPGLHQVAAEWSHLLVCIVLTFFDTGEILSNIMSGFEAVSQNKMYL